MARQNKLEKTILDAAASAKTGTNINVEDFKHCVLSFATDGGGDANLTVKFQGAVTEDAPDFSSAQAVDNMWDYVEVVDLEDGAAIDGDTGISVSGADDYRQVEMNTNGLSWINATVTARSEGEVTVKASMFDNQ